MNDIAAELFESQELTDCIEKFIPARHRDDFKQELLLIILNDKTGNVVSSYERGHIMFYTARIIINLSRQNQNIYHKKYAGHEKAMVELTDQVKCEPCEPVEIRVMAEQREERLITAVQHLDETMGSFYYRGIAELVTRCGSMREASRQTGIHYSTISRSMKKIREHLSEIK